VNLKVIPRFIVTGIDSDESSLSFCCLTCCSCYKKADIKITTSQSTIINAGFLGVYSIPVTYEFPYQIDSIDKIAIRDYVYGALDKKSIELHAMNHLLNGGLTKDIVVEEDFQSYIGGPSALSMDRGSRI